MWVEALRSDKYDQTKNHLADENGFCCLGVLCEIYPFVSDLKHYDHEENLYYYDSESEFLPEQVRDWAGVVEPDPKVVSLLGEKKTLSELNDAGVSFNEIAVLVEEQL